MISPSFLLKLAPYAIGALVVIGAFLYGVSVGKKNQKVIYQTKIIEAGKRHAEIEKKQGERVANRGLRIHISKLRGGNF